MKNCSPDKWEKILCLCLVLLLSVPCTGQASQKTWHLDTGESALLTFDGIQRIAVGNPDVVDARPLNSREVLLTARKSGNSTLVVWDRQGRHFQTLLVHPSSKARLWEIERLLAEEGVNVSLTETTTVLEGTVANPAAKARAQAIAKAFGPNVVNLLEISHADQIRLEATVLELDRSTGEKLGLQGVERYNDGFLTGFIDLASDFNHIGIKTLDGISGTQNFSAIVNALEERNLAKVLSKPYLTTLSGENANLNVGGEIPVPVGLDNGEIKIEWKPYGVMLSITPELDGKNSIWITLEAEVSEIDWDNRIVTSGIEVPALKTRRISNKVRLMPGQPLIVGGLIDNKQTELKTKIPLLGDLPIIGQLFRSRRFENSETELVITIVPEIVKQQPDRATIPQRPIGLSSADSYPESTDMDTTGGEGKSDTNPQRLSRDKAPSSRDSGGPWAVQVGALPNRKIAMERSEQLRAMGFSAEISEADVKGKHYFRVRVIAGKKRQSAVSLANDLTQRGFSTFITLKDA